MSHEPWHIICIYTWVTNYDALCVYVYESRTMTDYIYIHMSHELGLIICIFIWVTISYSTSCELIGDGGSSRHALQHSATRCNTLRHRATQDNTLQHSQHTATQCNTLQIQEAHVTPYNTMQQTATDCNRLQQTATHRTILQPTVPQYHSAPHCNTLPHKASQCRCRRPTSRSAGHCNTLQHTATHCSTLHHTATQCNTLQMEEEHVALIWHWPASTHVTNYDVLYESRTIYRWSRQHAHVTPKWRGSASIWVTNSQMTTNYTIYKLCTLEGGSTRKSRPSDMEVQVHESRTHTWWLLICVTIWMCRWLKEHTQEPPKWRGTGRRSASNHEVNQKQKVFRNL